MAAMNHGRMPRDNRRSGRLQKEGGGANSGGCPLFRNSSLAGKKKKEEEEEEGTMERMIRGRGGRAAARPPEVRLPRFRPPFLEEKEKKGIK